MQETKDDDGEKRPEEGREEKAEDSGEDQAGEDSRRRRFGWAPDSVPDRMRKWVEERLEEVSEEVFERVTKTVDVLTGEDIRRFNEFVDATTTVVVGLHRDQEELSARLSSEANAVGELSKSSSTVQQAIAELREAHTKLADGLRGAEGAIALLQKVLADMNKSADDAERSAAIGRRWLIGVGGMSGVALVTSVVAIVGGL